MLQNLREEQRTGRCGVEVVVQTMIGQWVKHQPVSDQQSQHLKSVPDGIATLAMTDDGQVVLAHAYCHPMCKILYTLLSGSMRDGTSPSQAARRVLADAAGLLAHQLTPLGRMAPFPDTIAETIHLFLARKLAPAPDQRGTPEADEVVLMDAIEALQRTLRGEFEDGALQLRYGLKDGRYRTLEEVGAEFRLTRERIRQIEAGALRKLRHPYPGKKLRGYLK